MDIQKYLKTEVANSKNLLREMKKNPDKDLNHQLRVSIRRIRTVVQLLEKDGKTHLPKNESQILRKTWKHLGTVRDFDVSEEIAEENELPLQRIRSQRKAADKKLNKDLVTNDLRKLLDHLGKLSSKKNLKEVHPGQTIQTIRQKLKALPLETDNLHAFRIILKKVRYLMEAMNIEDKEFKKYQDVLGQLNDLKVFLECQGESPRVRKVYKKQLKKASLILRPASKLALRSLSKAEKQL